jgi:predicted nucleic acid-binding protein
MPQYMLDTDISSYIMNRASEAAIRKLQSLAVGDACISAITRSELEQFSFRCILNMALLREA